MIDVSGHRLKHLVELSRALKDRLSDTQINLKPIAARTIGALLSKVDKGTQAKLGKVFFAPLINAAMNDIKKPMKDASIDALTAGTTASSLEGDGLNEEALEVFVSALVAEVNEGSSRVSFCRGLVRTLWSLISAHLLYPGRWLAGSLDVCSQCSRVVSQSR